MVFRGEPKFCSYRIPLSIIGEYKSKPIIILSSNEVV